MRLSFNFGFGPTFFKLELCSNLHCSQNRSLKCKCDHVTAFLKSPSSRSSSTSQDLLSLLTLSAVLALVCPHLHSLILPSHFSQSPEYKSRFHCSLGLEFLPLLGPPSPRTLMYTGRHNWLHFWACPHLTDGYPVSVKQPFLKGNKRICFEPIMGDRTPGFGLPGIHVPTWKHLHYSHSLKEVKAFFQTPLGSSGWL